MYQAERLPRRHEPTTLATTHRYQPCHMHNLQKQRNEQKRGLGLPNNIPIAITAVRRKEDKVKKTRVLGRPSQRTRRGEEEQWTRYQAEGLPKRHKPTTLAMTYSTSLITFIAFRRKEDKVQKRMVLERKPSRRHKTRTLATTYRYQPYHIHSLQKKRRQGQEENSTWLAFSKNQARRRRAVDTLLGRRPP